MAIAFIAWKWRRSRQRRKREREAGAKDGPPDANDRIWGGSEMSSDAGSRRTGTSRSKPRAFQAGGVEWLQQPPPAVTNASGPGIVHWSDFYKMDKQREAGLAR